MTTETLVWVALTSIPFVVSFLVAIWIKIVRQGEALTALIGKHQNEEDLKKVVANNTAIMEKVVRVMADTIDSMQGVRQAYDDLMQYVFSQLSDGKEPMPGLRRMQKTPG